MFDARYFAYAAISALLVASPGATMAVVFETALARGRVAALYTVIGVNIGNSTLAFASALGMSFVLHQWPWTLQVVKGGGAVYLSYLGLRAIWTSVCDRPASGTRPNAGGGPVIARTPGCGVGSTGRWSAVVRGITTNLLNPPVILFYMTFLPQFISAQDPFFARFLVLAATHVSMSLLWLSFYAFTLGALAERLSRPAVRRTLEALTGLLLVGFGVRLIWR